MDSPAGSAALSDRPWRSVAAPDDVLAVPTMLSAQEQALLYWLARDYATGEGAIVDAGCFLGGSSAALLAGMRDRPGGWSGPPLASYDQFVVEPYTVDQYFADDEEMRPGASFRSRYDRNVSGYGVPHEVHEGDITVAGWNGGPIEVLFLDVLKTWEVNDAVTRDFFPHVVPGRTVLVHQDYAYGMLPWIHIGVELMRDSLRLLDELPYATQAFLVERPIDPAVLATPVASLDADRKLALIDRALDANSGDTREMIELSKAALLDGLGQPREARALAQRIFETTSSVAVRECARITLTSTLSPPATDGKADRPTTRGGLERLIGRLSRRS